MIKRKMKVVSMLMPGGTVILGGQYFFSRYFSGFTGTDDQSVGIIKEIAPDYKPWISSVLEFNNDNMEPVLFALQALIGIVIIGYYIFKSVNKEKA